MIKWLRKYRLTIQNQKARPTDEDEAPVIIEYPLTLDLAIVRASWGISGTATFRIYNLSQETRGKIYRNYTEIPKLMTIKLEAGYGDNLSTVFDGNVNWARSSRSEGSVNFITEINAFDYGFVMTNSQSNWPVQGIDASKDAVIRRLCSDLKRPVNGIPTSIPVGAIGAFDKTAQRSFSASGNTWSQIVELTGGNCFIDSGKVFCIAPNEVVIGDITEISNDTGLLGTPTIDGIHLSAEMLFEPGLKIGQKVNLKSTSLNSKDRGFDGIYKIISLEHSGTISGAVSGKLKTKVLMMVGSKNFENPFDVVPGSL